MHQRKALMKRKTPRSSKYLKWLRKLPCVVCQTITKPTEAAHVRFGNDGGMGLKPSDYRAVPLCHDCHTYQHTVGEPSFWRDYQMQSGHSIDDVILQLMRDFLDDDKAAMVALEDLLESRR